MDDIETETTLLDKSGIYEVPAKYMSFACPSKVTHVTLERSASLTGGPRARFTRANTNSLFRDPDGNLSESVKVPEGSTVKYEFDGGELEIEGPGSAYSKGADGFFESNGYGRSTWREPERVLKVGRRSIIHGPSVSFGATWFTCPNPAMSQNEKHDELIIEVPHTLSGLDTLRLEGETVNYQSLADFSIRNLQIVEDPRISASRSSAPGTQRPSGENDDTGYTAKEMFAMRAGGKC